ncbi:MULTISPECIES: hypothetical protein [unclassified Aeromicrobium]|jgi:hypothetical protein|uniref:hypothetical protein n=1 Tax=unclassified Aeromicrobium TaxID=2633570 RepID=UPI000ADF5BD7|nr:MULTISPECIES: hypothetical protein [unclassified Aeromicrobium]
MARRLAWPLVVVGLLLALAGAAVMAVLGPDSRFTTGPHTVRTDGVAVVTAPDVITYRGLQVDVLVEVPVNKPVFVGLGNTVDVQDYLAGTRRLEVTSFRAPWTVRTAERRGRAALPGAPTALDWWIADSAGLGGASISTTLPDTPVSLAILAVGASDLSGLRVTFAYGVRGGFGLGLGALLGGLGLIWSGLLLRRGPSASSGGLRRPWRERGDGPLEVGEEVEVVEEEVYVFVDERGVEHEITAEEAARLQERLAADALEPTGPDPTSPDSISPDSISPDSTHPDPAGPDLDSAGDVAVEVPPPAVVYVFVDEDGVEHEVSEEELADYELADDEPADERSADDERRDR